MGGVGLGSKLLLLRDGLMSTHAKLGRKHCLFSKVNDVAAHVLLKRTHMSVAAKKLQTYPTVISSHSNPTDPDP